MSYVHKSCHPFSGTWTCGVSAVESMLSPEEITSLEQSTDPTIRLMLHLNAKNQAAEEKLRSDFASLEGKIIDKTEQAVAEISKLRNEVDIFKRELKSDHEAMKSTVTERMANVELELVKVQNSVSESLLEKQQQIDSIIQWQQRAEVNGLQSLQSSAIGHRQQNRQKVEQKKIELRVKMHHAEALKLRSRVVIGSKGQSVVNGQRAKNPVDVTGVENLIQLSIPNSVFKITKLTPSLVAVQFFDIPGGNSASTCAELLVSQYVDINITLNAWIKLDQPVALRDAHRRTVSFANYYKSSVDVSCQPYYRIVNEHLLMDELLICPEILVPDREFWPVLSKVVDSILDTDYALYDPTKSFTEQYSPLIVQCLQEIRLQSSFPGHRLARGPKDTRSNESRVPDDKDKDNVVPVPGGAVEPISWSADSDGNPSATTCPPLSAVQRTYERLIAPIGTTGNVGAPSSELPAQAMPFKEQLNGKTTYTFSDDGSDNGMDLA